MRRQWLLWALAVMVMLLHVGTVIAGDTPGINDRPENIPVSPVPDTTPRTAVAIPWAVTDPDVGGGTMDMEINIADHDGLVPPAQVGTISWLYGINVTSDVATATLAQLNNALSGLSFRPAAGFVGKARIVFEIDDNGNTGIGGEMSDTDFIIIDVCGIGEVGTADCLINNPPINHVPSPAPDTAPQTSVAVTATISDADTSAVALMRMEINLADHQGAFTPAQVGTFSWGFGPNVTSDTALGTIAQINAALASLSFHPAAGFAGQARLVFEIDDQGNTGSGGAKSDTDFIVIDVCTPEELGMPSCLVNGAPINVLPAIWTTPSETTLPIPFNVTDPDVGSGQMQMELNLVDANGVLPPASVGTLTWPFGVGVTADSVITSRASINNALALLVFTPAPTFTGTARVVMEIDDRGNSGTGGQRSDTDFRNIPVTPRPGAIGMASTCVRSAGENTSISIPVKRLAGDDGAASVTVSLQDGTAIGGADFALLSASVMNWADQDRSDRAVVITIINDGLVEPVETFSVNLQSATGAALGNPSTVTVRIDPQLQNDKVVMADGFEEIACP